MFSSKLFAHIVITSLLTISCQELSSREEKAVPECLSDGQEFCKSCSVSASCIYVGSELREFNSTCLAGTVCNSATNICDGTATTDPNCYCLNSAGITYQADPYNDHWYIICINGAPTYADCGALYYDGINGCTDTPPNSVTCEAPGVFPNPNDPTCAGYLICSTNGSDPVLDSCPPGSGGPEYFDPNTNLCAPFPAEFVCTVSGAFGDPFDCRRYHICVGQTETNTGCCNVGMIYSTAVATCITDDGSCTSIECGTSQQYCI